MNINFFPQRQESKQEMLMPEHQRAQSQVHGEHNPAYPGQFYIVINKGRLMVLQGSYSFELFKSHDFFS